MPARRLFDSRINAQSKIKKPLILLRFSALAGYLVLEMIALCGGYMSDTCDGNCGACQLFPRAENQPEKGAAILYGGVWVKPTIMPDAGMVVPQHSHRYDHVSFLATGSVRVWQDGEMTGEYQAPASICIPALKKHLFEILEPRTLILCIHNAERGDLAEVSEETLTHEGHEIVEMEGAR
jgi:hypothetical protein